MAAQVQITNVHSWGSSVYFTFNVVLSGNYATNGDPLNFTPSGTLPVIVDPQYVGMVPDVKSSSLLNVDVWGMGGGSIAASNQTNYCPVVTKAGTPVTINPATGVKLKVAALGAFTEHAASAYESQYTGDTITGMAVFLKLQ